MIVKEKSLDITNHSHLKHIALIMDGNGRWARSKKLPRIEGHRRGAHTVRMVVKECRKLGVQFLTLFTFSTENWRRPHSEVNALMKLLHYHLVHELEELYRNGVRIRVIGELDKLPASVRLQIKRAESYTAKNSDLNLILAISYGGRKEIVEAAKSLAVAVKEGSLEVDEIDEEMFSGRLYAPDIPDPDLLIRTSNEFRISNFLLWQLAYSEIIVTDLHWPDFSKEEFHLCIREYYQRNRRFGYTSEQLQLVNGLDDTGVASVTNYA